MDVQTGLSNADEKGFSLKHVASLLFPLHQTGHENIPATEERYLRSPEVIHTYTEGTFRPAGAKDAHTSREILTISDGLFGDKGFSNERTLKIISYSG